MAVKYRFVFFSAGLLDLGSGEADILQLEAVFCALGANADQCLSAVAKDGPEYFFASYADMGVHIDEKMSRYS